MAAAEARFELPMASVFAGMKGLLAARQQRELTPAETVRLMALQARLDGLAMEQKHFAEADLALRLGHRDE